MSVYNDMSQDDASSVEMKKKTKEMKIRVAKVIFVAFNKFIVIERFAESALNHSKVYQQSCPAVRRKLCFKNRLISSESFLKLANTNSCKIKQLFDYL